MCGLPGVGKDHWIAENAAGWPVVSLDANVEKRRFTGHTKSVWGAAFSPDGKYAISGGDDASLRLWDVETGKQLRRFQRHSAAVTGVAFSPDVRYAVSGGADNTLRLWAIPAGNGNRGTAAP